MIKAVFRISVESNVYVLKNSDIRKQANMANYVRKATSKLCIEMISAVREFPLLMSDYL